MAIAGAANLWRNPVWWIMNPLLGNGFPLAKEGSVRPSLENMGKIMDDGWSVLIYPEGELTVGGPIKPFMNGTGLVAVEGRIPVVPLRLHIHRLGSPKRFPFFRRGSVEVSFGEPLSFRPGRTTRTQRQLSRMQSSPYDGRRWASSVSWSSAYEQTVKAWVEVAGRPAPRPGVWLSWTLLAKSCAATPSKQTDVLDDSGVLRGLVRRQVSFSVGEKSWQPHRQTRTSATSRTSALPP